MGTKVSARGAHPDHKSPEGSSAVPPVGSLRPFQEIHEIKLFLQQDQDLSVLPSGSLMRIQ